MKADAFPVVLAIVCSMTAADPSETVSIPLLEDAVGAGLKDVDDQLQRRHVSSSFTFFVK
jgi:hypothetical protein